MEMVELKHATSFFHIPDYIGLNLCVVLTC